MLWLGLFGGMFGFALALGMQLFTNFDYPINVGGRPLYALSAFVVVCFELTVLFAALTPAIGMLALNGLPRLHHPVFGASAFPPRLEGSLLPLRAGERREIRRRKDQSTSCAGLEPASVELVEAMKRRPFCIVACVLLAGCTRSNMDSQPKYHEYEPGALFRDGTVLQAPVPGTVARGDLERAAEEARQRPP